MHAFSRHPAMFPGMPASPGSERIDQLSQLQGLDNMAQQADSGRNADLMHMLSTLYGISHESAMQPEQLRALRASSAAKEYETSAAPQMTAADLALKGAQGRHLDAETGAMKEQEPDMKTGAMLVQLGYLKPEDLMSMGQRSKTWKPAADSYFQRFNNEATQKAQARAEDESRMQAATAQEAKTGVSTPAAVGSKLGAKLSTSIYDMPSTAYNAVGGAADFVGGLLGLPEFLRSARLHSASEIEKARAAGTDYNSYFYNPNNPEERFPLPVARK